MATGGTSEREFDLVLYGASGFVGRLTAAHVAKRAPDFARIAVAGRNADKLQAVLDEIGGVAHTWPIIEADAGSPESLRSLAARTRVIVTTVGPYAQYGLPLVEACAKEGTDYADLTGEQLFVHDTVEKFHELAIENGARIVHSCGFDSVPSDINTYLLYKHALADDAGELNDTTLYVKAAKGGLSGGTVASGRRQMEREAEDRELARVTKDPYTLSTDRALEPDLGKQSDNGFGRASEIDPDLTGWTGTFLMAPYNTRIVRRTNGLLGWAYGKQFQYREVMGVGSGVAAPIVAGVMSGVLGALWKVGPTLFRRAPKKIIDTVLPQPGTGPSEKSRLTGFFVIETYATTSSGARYKATFKAQGDPGYAATAVMLGESGLCLAFDRDALSPLTGVITPAAAMGDALPKRLRDAGITLTTTRI
ncbi:saccharopine dehydrogenase NADP-binding domain-containing protein [Hoyosella rhizosphaerae]|uniref:Enoyl reductase n=1 Tax=Hoyosella rhizosphaerae TaxID=1755582 RepID=A0A916XJT7_9ACTN|nr:saccharopine dehydrogenase NADP-binding domain-containing protein [Hoyosella rhizosphaerae]MBN4925389.1 saccharopine dehydrogenase NADP-binding domain-containing protein [Hoyosella rhizosphaerae]GGC75615.1 enoyl reductase [Hoyosella rhizosphaerae]